MNNMGNMEKGTNFEQKEKLNLDEIIEKTGYKEVSTIEELELSPEEIKQAKNLIDLSNIRFFAVSMSDEVKVKAIIFEGESSFNAHIFSPKGHEGHMFNHDFSARELEGILRIAKDEKSESF